MNPTVALIRIPSLKLTAGLSLNNIDFQGLLLFVSWRVTFNSKLTTNIDLVGGFNPFENYARQIASFPQF